MNGKYGHRNRESMGLQQVIHSKSMDSFTTDCFIKVPIVVNKKKFVYKLKVNPNHTILKYDDYHDFINR